MLSKTRIDLLKIEFCRLEADLLEGSASCCGLLIVSDNFSRAIVDWRLLPTPPEGEAGLMALATMLTNGTNTTRTPFIGQRYGYGKIEYEISAIWDNCIWLRRAHFQHLDASALHIPSADASKCTDITEQFPIEKTKSLAMRQQRSPQRNIRPRARKSP